MNYQNGIRHLYILLRFVFFFSIVIPLVNGCIVALISESVTQDIGNRFIFSILAASASYIAVPAVLRHALPEVNPALYMGMSLGITFPFNIIIGIPLYSFVAQLLR